MQIFLFLLEYSDLSQRYTLFDINIIGVLMKRNYMEIKNVMSVIKKNWKKWDGMSLLFGSVN